MRCLRTLFTRAPFFLCSLDESIKSTIVAVVEKKVSKPTNNGSNMLILDLEDSSGAISAVGFGRAHDVFVDKINEGQTYKFVGVKPRQNRLKNVPEISLWDNTKIEEHVPIEIRKTFGTIANAKESGRDKVRVAAVLSELGDEAISSSGSPMRRGVAIDTTSEINIFVFGQRATESVDRPGDIFHIEGRISKGGILVDKMEKVTDDALATFWKQGGMQQVEKRQKLSVPICSIADCADAHVGQKFDAVCIVRSASIAAQPAGARYKRNYNIVDNKSVCAIDIAVFGEMEVVEAMEPFKVGSAVRVVGEVSSYGNKSVNVKTMLSANDDELVSWWKSTGCTLVFNNLTDAA